MSVICREKALEILTDLIAIPSVNPMGRDWNGTEPVERKAIEYVERLFAPYGVAMTRSIAGPMHENLLIAVPGRTDRLPTLFKSHVDTVPADEWNDRAFTPRVEGDTVYGRGACDDKGPLAAMILAVMDVLESGDLPPCPVLLLAAGDEEYAQTGIKSFRAADIPVGRGVFGEPTDLIPIVQHKGTIRWDITVHGRSAHTSRPELGVNAILGMMEVISRLRGHQEALPERYAGSLTTGPALTVSMIRGGRTRNAVPDECTIALDFRIVPGMDLKDARREVIEILGELGLTITHGEPQLETPPLDTAPSDPFSQKVLEICRRHVGPDVELAGVPYGTDASRLADRAPCLVLGPGSIVSAHAVDEQIDVTEVVRCARIYRDIMAADYSA